MDSRDGGGLGAMSGVSMARVKAEAPSFARIVTLESLREHLPWAIELEHFTLPPYLCALYSLDAVRNPEASEVVASVLVAQRLMNQRNTDRSFTALQSLDFTIDDDEELHTVAAVDQDLAPIDGAAPPVVPDAGDLLGRQRREHELPSFPQQRVCARACRHYSLTIGNGFSGWLRNRSRVNVRRRQ